MYRQLLICLLVCFPLYGMAQAKLENLLSERDRMHREWKASESKKSGIFGNRTKKDMIETNAWMERIIQKDNQVMDELRMLNEIQTTEITYEKNDYKFISQKQEREIAILKRALAEKDLSVEEKKSDKRTYEWTTLIFFLSTMTFAYLFYRQKKTVKVR
ncbi:Clp protease ClpB [Cecembia sp.]|uniref:Clp protease ClpB n=1 Tax=Cecembia sp. TaxID=1898110 RepID=UPI0025B8A476|nr:Clp protease ClpB [Cecembia sp.]